MGIAIPRISAAYEVLLRWTTPPDPDVLGYDLYSGPVSAGYTQRTQVANPSDLTAGGLVYYLLPNLQLGTNYYLAVTAYNSAGLESGYSNEKPLSFASVSPPPVDAGPDQVGQAGDVLDLGTAALPGVSYFWRQTGGPPATLSSRVTSRTQFQSAYAGTFDFTLVAFDAQGIAADDAVSIVLTGGILPTATVVPTPTASPALATTRTASSTPTPGPASPTAPPSPTSTPLSGGVRLYLTSLPPSFSPAQAHGQWLLAPTTRVLWGSAPAGPFGSVLQEETTTTAADVGLLWAVSEPLASVQFSPGSALTWGIEVSGLAEDAELYWHVHLSVLAGSTDGVRCTLIDNYREASGSGNAWPAIPLGVGPVQPVPLDSCTSTPPQPGDRLALELGYVARNTLASPYYGLLNYGSTRSDVVLGQSGGAAWVDLLGASLSFLGPPTLTPAGSATATSSPTRSPTRSATPRSTATSSVTPLGSTPTRTASRTPTRTPTRTPSRSPTRSPTATPTPLMATPTSRTPTPTPTASATPGESRVRLYLTSLAPSYAPPLALGSWDLPPAVTVRLDRAKAGSLETALSSETTTAVVSVGLLWGVSEPLAVADFPAGSRIDWGIEAAEQSDDADLFWQVHAYVLAGSSNTVRCTLLSDYQETASSNNEWTILPVARSARPQPPELASCGTSPPQAGDRLAIEIGFVARNGFASYRFGFLNYGSTAADAIPGTVGGAGWVDLIGATVTF